MSSARYIDDHHILVSTPKRHIIPLVGLIVVLFLFQGELYAQTYKEVALQKGIDHMFGLGSTGGGVSFHDFDGDGWDDITLTTERGRPIYFYKNNNGTFERLEALVNNLCESKQVLWIDYDNDGDKDLFVTCHSDVNRLYNNDNMVFADVTEESGLSLAKLKTYGATWGDVDRDGWLDLYVTNKRTDEEININNLYLNLGNGTFQDITLLSHTADSMKRPFCASFIDINHDLFPDIYIAQDKKATNTLLKNMGNGTFSDISVSSDANLVMDGMSVTIGDYNNDQNLDIYITNIPEGNKLLKNNGNETFQEVAMESGVDYLGYGWGANFLDYDLDGDLDLYVSGMLEGSGEIPSILYTNVGMGNYSNDDLGFKGDTVTSYSNAIGDLDNDGFPDIIVNNFDNYHSMLWKNSAGDNHWIKIKLEGVSSNRDGIGAFIYVYYSGSVIIHYTGTANGFLAQNSAYSMIGLGASEIMDSIKVLWPSGQTDMLRQINSNQAIIIREGSTRLPPRIYYSDKLSFCEGDSIVLETGYYETYTWNNGETSRSIQIKSPGDYSVQVSDAEGRTAYSDTVNIKVLEMPEVDILIEPADFNQYNGSIEALVSGGASPYQYLWSVSGRDTSYVTGIGPGVHTLEVTDQNGCSILREVEVNLVTGIETESYAFTIFPNPVEEDLYILADDLLLRQNLSIELYTISGKLVYSKQIHITDRVMPVPFNLNALDPGLYIILGTFKNGTFSRKLRIK